VNPPVRSEVYFVKLGDLGRKPFVVVSNNHRNRALITVLGIRITTTNPNVHLETVVALGRDCGDLTGWALCDDMVQLWTAELARPAGVVGPRTMAAINNGLRTALAL
jgi:mRNA interferase MazF